MLIHRAFIVLPLISGLLLGPVEAGILSWLHQTLGSLFSGNNKGTSSTALTGNSYGKINGFGINGKDNFGSGNHIFSGVYINGAPSGPHADFADSGINPSGPLVYKNGKIISGSFDTMVYGSVFKVRIRQYKGKDGNCEEEIMIVWLEKKSGKTIYTKCKNDGSSRRIETEDKLLLVGDPNESFCAFTTNRNEIFYLNNGKWMKGDFSGDNTKDKELTSSEISTVKERISKWNAYLERNEKEKQRIKRLKAQEKEKSVKRKEDIKALREKEKQKHRGIRNNIKELRKEEKTRHKLEMERINNIRKKEGWTEKIEQLQADEDDKQAIEEAKLNQMETDEELRYSDEYNKYNTMLEEEYAKYEEEISKLDALRDEADQKAMKELEEMISQGM